MKSIPEPTRTWLKGTVKVGLTVALLYVVLRQIDLPQAWQLVRSAHGGWLLLALLLFNGSKLTAAGRVRRFFAAAGLTLAPTFNLRLYYVGLFYNLLLPGGIGGDGYKVYVLHRRYGTRVRTLTAAVLADRLSGMAALTTLMALLALGLPAAPLPPWARPAAVGLTLGAMPALYPLLRRLLPAFTTNFFTTSLFSFGVQGWQLLCATALLAALRVTDPYLPYLVLFLVSSVVAVLPVTVGGVGARELVFLLGYSYLGIDPDRAVVFSLLFFLVSALSAVPGIFLEQKRLQPPSAGAVVPVERPRRVPSGEQP